MNDLMKVSYGAELTMDSRDIASLTGKRHSTVLFDIDAQLGKLPGGMQGFLHTYVNEQNGQQYRYYLLPYRETMILVSGYSVELRAKIIDRWMELEQASKPAIPKTYAEALQLAADQQREIDQKNEALALAAPKVASAEALMRCDKNMSITDTAKRFSLHPRTEVFPYLREHNYLTKKNLPTQKAIDAGYLKLAQTVLPDDTTKPQAVVPNNQLENWRLTMVPRVKKWLEEIE